MSVHQEKNGTWYYHLKYKDIYGIEKWTKKRGFKLKRDAIQAEKEFLQNANKTTLPFNIMFREYLETCNVQDGLRKRKSACLKEHFPLYKNDINKITKRQLLSWRNDLIKKDLTNSARNRYMSYVKSLYKYANKYYDIEDISSVLENFPKDKRKEMQVWTIDEFNEFISYVQEPVYKAFFHFLFWTGCRRGEAIALEKTDINGNACRICKSVRLVSQGAKGTKTESSVRTILLDNATLKVLKDYWTTEKGYLVFGGMKYLSPSNISRAFKQAISDSGVKPIRLHDLRHSHATILINSGANIVAVSKRLGHSDISMTLKVYTHLLRDTENQLIGMLNNIVDNHDNGQLNGQ